MKTSVSATTGRADWGALAPRGLPEIAVFCSKCVVSNQKPISSIEASHAKNDYKKTINFKDGICDACVWASLKEQEIDWEKRQSELEHLCDKHRKNNGRYDVIVPASGGKDSRYVAHLLKHRYGMNPLTVTWMPHKFTDVGWLNFQSLIANGFSNIMYAPPGDVHRRLSTLAFKNLGHVFQPFIVGQRAVGPKTALQYNIKLVFYGENVAEYGNRLEDNYSPLMDPRLFACFNFDKDRLDEFMLAGLKLSDLIKNYGFSLGDLEQYKSPSTHDIESSGVEVHYMSYYRKWVPQENYYYAVKHTGFVPNDKRKDGSYSKYAGIDDMLEDLHFFMQYIKFGMGRCTWDSAQEIRTGKLERGEAISLIRKFDHEPPKEFLNEILEYLNLTTAEFWEVVNSFRPKHLWAESTDRSSYILKQPIR